MRNTCKTLYFNPNKCVWKHNRKGKISTGNKLFSSSCYTEVLRPSFSFHFMFACWEYSRKNYLTLNSTQPKRKRHLKIILTRWVMTAGESKAELSAGSFHNLRKPGIFLSKARTHDRSFNWPWLGSSMRQSGSSWAWLKLGTTGSVLSLWHARICVCLLHLCQADTLLCPFG